MACSIAHVIYKCQGIKHDIWISSTWGFTQFEVSLSHDFSIASSAIFNWPSIYCEKNLWSLMCVHLKKEWFSIVHYKVNKIAL